MQRKGSARLWAAGPVVVLCCCVVLLTKREVPNGVTVSAGLLQVRKVLSAVPNPDAIIEEVRDAQASTPPRTV